jgi:pimeloyl-ACP methyl ester carboxylesterase
MRTAEIDGLDIAYDVIGEGDHWVITPGGRFDMESPGVRQLAEELARTGKQVLVWDRPNVGGSSVCFSGENESAMQADTLAGLLRHLDMAPAVIIGGSGGSRVSLLTAVRNRDVVRGVALWWISGGTFGLMSIGVYYCGESIQAAWNGGMEAVVELPAWQEVLERTPANRQRFLEQDPKAFIATLERWLLTYCPCGDELVPGLPDADARAFDVPTLVFRSGASDMHHTRATSENLASLLPNATLVEPPWGDTEWIDRSTPEAREEGLFARWPLLAPALIEWADRELAG